MEHFSYLVKSVIFMWSPILNLAEFDQCVMERKFWTESFLIYLVCYTFIRQQQKNTFTKMFNLVLPTCVDFSLISLSFMIIEISKTKRISFDTKNKDQIQWSAIPPPPTPWARVLYLSFCDIYITMAWSNGKENIYSDFLTIVTKLTYLP